MEFHSFAAADLACRVCGLAKRTLRDIGREKVCGVCYGYHLKTMGSPHNLFNTGHQAMQRVLECPEIDFVVAPYGYQWRHAGGVYHAQVLTGSLRLHDTLYICEDDTFTHLAPEPPTWNNRPVCPDLRTTIGVLRRNHAGVLQDGGGQWWMDCCQQGWYGDDRLVAAAADLAALADRSLDEPRTPAAQIAAVMDEMSLRYLRQDRMLADPINSRQVLELCCVGAPCDWYRLADLPLLLDRPRGRRYRLFVFPDALHVPPAIRGCIAERLAADGRTLLWTCAAGLVTEGGLSVEAMGELVGIRLRQYAKRTPALVETWLTGTRVVYGTNDVLAPLFYPDDDGLDVQGWLVNVERPGLVTRGFGGWRSVWSSAPAVPAPVLRELARAAGVHIYGERGDQVFRAGSLLAVHAGSDGSATLKLPAAETWTDALTGETEQEHAVEITVHMRRGDTRIWRSS